MYTAVTVLLYTEQACKDLAPDRNVTWAVPKIPEII